MDIGTNIYGNQTYYLVESSAVVTCSSNFSVISMEWSYGGNIMSFTANASSLNLVLTKLSTAMNNRTYLCSSTILMPESELEINVTASFYLAGKSKLSVEYSLCESYL